MKPRLEILIDTDGEVEIRMVAMNDGEDKSVLDVYEKVSHLIDGIEFVLSGDHRC